MIHSTYKPTEADMLEMEINQTLNNLYFDVIALQYACEKNRGRNTPEKHYTLMRDVLPRVQQIQGMMQHLVTENYLNFPTKPEKKESLT